MNEKSRHSIAGTPWFYEKGGKRSGGFSERDIITLIDNGTIYYGTPMWRPGFDKWLQIENTELRKHLENFGPPPLTGARVSNSVVWLLAVAPIIGLLSQYFVSGIIHNDNEYLMVTAVKDGDYWYITVLINIVLCLWDAKRLRVAGTDTTRFSKWVWLVPIYRFQRSKALKHNQACFVTWTFLFIISIALAQ